MATEARDAFAEWLDRFGDDGTSTLSGIRAALARGGSRRSVLARVAGELGLPVAAVHGAASFYADLAIGRRGRRHVQLCGGTSCLAAAGPHHIGRVEQALGVRCGQCTPDGAVSLQEVHCLGHCYTSPAALDGTRPVAGAGLAARLAAGEPGAAAPIPFRSVASRTVVLAGLTGLERSWQVWPQVLATGSPAAVVSEVDASGLRGRGGAEFPVGAKWRAAAAGAAPKYVVANGDEGDPGSFCDRLLMESDPHRVLEGLALCGLVVGARRGFVLVRSEYPVASDRLRQAVDDARAAGQLGTDLHGSGTDFDIEVVRGAGSYVAGEETALLRALQGLRGGVHPRPPYPTGHGFGGHPTVVNNVETLAAVPWIVRHGGAAYAQLGLPGETGTKLVCLNALFAAPGVYEVEFGVSLRYLVEELGGGLRDGATLRALQVGGPLGGFLRLADLDLPLSASALAGAGVALGHGSLVAIDDTLPPRDLLTHVWAFAADESCGGCAPCRVGTRRGLELSTVDGSDKAVVPQRDRLLEVMAAGSMCAFGRGVPAAVRSLQRVCAEELS